MSVNGNYRELRIAIVEEMGHPGGLEAPPNSPQTPPADTEVGSVAPPNSPANANGNVAAAAGRVLGDRDDLKNNVSN